MSSTRHAPSVQIYQDPATAYEQPSKPRHHRSISSASALQNFQDRTSKNDFVFNPPTTGPSRPSPKKFDRQSSSPPKAVFSSKFNIISIPTPTDQTFTTDSPAKRPTCSTFNTRTHRPQKALFTTFSSSRPVDKENHNPAVNWNDRPSTAPDSTYGQKAPLKRALLELAPTKDRPVKKAKMEEPAVVEIPNPEDMPMVEDDGSKPPYSYALLIGMSILRAPNRRLTLAQIYKWISDSFSYYRSTEAGWQNSIRHNLSLNKSFIKQERPKDDPGKGNYWAIAPGSESTFLKDKPIRKGNTNDPNALPPHSKKESAPRHMIGESVANIHVAPKRTVTFDDKKFSAGVEPSSDATIPASDLALQDDETDDNYAVRPPSREVHSSPPPMLKSSPPLAHHSHISDGTPPPAPQLLPSSNNGRSRKRKIGSMNDSGYFSSLDSSALRPHNIQQILTSEGDLDRPRIKRGRAEEEIARIRQSSHESPSKSRPILRQPPAPFQSSSPLRNFDSSLMLPPLTPAQMFKMPPRPPPSVSPTTNLRNHRNKVRDLVGSPVKGLGGTLTEDIPWSPAFNLPDDELAQELAAFNSTTDLFTASNFNGPNDMFSIFVDNLGDDILTGRASFPSPTKHSSSDTKRPSLARASTTGHILADITGLSSTNKTNLNIGPHLSRPCSPIKMPFLRSPAFSESPNKSPRLHAEAFALPQEDVFGAVLFNEDVDDDFAGVDILQGFQKIGQSKPAPGGAAAARGSPRNGVAGARQGLGRSMTSRF
ncbi:MAG: hypothetical protein M1824_006194 [Vezdaea acicularis]|nr:MAG: hypothetical protein M1824_006194 [Vezdaea acicularis]